MAAEKPFELPRQLDRYLLREVLGSGPRGTVYLAGEGGEVRAVKIYRAGVPVDRRALERLVRGAPQGIRHPALMPVDALGEDDARLYVVTRFLPGDSLRRVLDDHRRGRAERPSLSPLAVGPAGEIHPAHLVHVARLFMEVAEGLELLHAEGICHKRLSPENLILSPGGRLVVTDLGGEAGDDDARHLAYRAPEQLAVQTASMPQTDVYALGAVLYELATFQPLIDTTGLSARKARLEILKGRFRMPRTVRDAVPPPLEDCILNAVATEAQERYSSAGTFAADLRNFLSGETPRATKLRELVAPPPPRGFWRGVPGRVAVAILLTATLVAAIVGGGFVGSDRDEQHLSARRLIDDGRYSQAVTEANRMLSENPGDLTALALRETASRTAASMHLVRVIDALQTRDTDLAARELRAAREFLPEDSPGQRLGAAIQRLKPREPLADAIEDSRPAVRATGLRELAAEVVEGRRLPSDLILAVPALHDEDLQVREAAFDAFGVAGSSVLLLEALGLEPEALASTEEIVLDGATFLLLYRTLTSIDDDLARGFVDSLTRDATESLDRLPRVGSVLLPTIAVRVEMSENTARELTARYGEMPFTSQWLRTMARLEPQIFFSAARELMEHRAALPAMLDALRSMVDDPRAVGLAVGIAERHFLTAGEAALDLLVEMDAGRALLDLARGSLPVEYRELALSRLGRFSGNLRAELASVLRTSPDARLRRRALLLLSNDMRTADRDPSDVLLVAVNDPALREEALAWLERLPSPLRSRLCVRLISHRRDAVRDRALRLLLADTEPEIFRPLVFELFSSNENARRAAASVLLKRKDLERLARTTAKLPARIFADVGRHVSERFPVKTLARDLREEVATLGARVLQGLEKKPAAGD